MNKTWQVLETCQVWSEIVHQTFQVFKTWKVLKRYIEKYSKNADLTDLIPTFRFCEVST